LRIGVDVGGTNTDAVLIDQDEIIASTKHPTTADVSEGVAIAIERVLLDSAVAPANISVVMIGTTHFTNALIERERLDRVGVMRLASPSGEALPPMTAWPTDLVGQIGSECFLLPGGYEVDGREIAPFDERQVRDAARALKQQGVYSIAISSAFAPLNHSMEELAARIIRQEFPEARTSLSHRVGRLGLVERENGAILNAALLTLADRVADSLRSAIGRLGLSAKIYISQNDGTLISVEQARQNPVQTIGSGPTNSMRGAAFLTGLENAIVVDVGGTTSDFGVLKNGFPRESSVAVDIGGVRTNFPMPDIFALGLGGGSRIHLDEQLYSAAKVERDTFRIGPDSVGYRIAERAFLFGGDTLTASDVALLCGAADFGNRAGVPQLSDGVRAAIWQEIQAKIAAGIDRVKTAPGDCDLVAVGGGSFLIGAHVEGAARVIKPRFAEVANAVGAAIAQVGGQIDQIVDYDLVPREKALARLKDEAARKAVSSGGDPRTAQIVDVDEIFLSYLPGRCAQVRVKAVCDLSLAPEIHRGAQPVQGTTHAD
jgi:N-methylhydantoinase A/oxoprolinase/acetone carboxylase beta subunit